MHSVRTAWGRVKDVPLGFTSCKMGRCFLDAERMNQTQPWALEGPLQRRVEAGSLAL